MEKTLDRELIAAAMRGDELAFSQVYWCYRDRVYNFAYRMLAKRSVAEDVTHEAFLALIQHPERYRPERSSLLTYLCAIARNHIFNYLRRWENQMAEPIETLAEFAAPASSEQNPLTDLLRCELAAKVEAAIGALPPLLREVVVLREYQGLSYEEMTMVIGADMNVVKVRLHRARQALARQLTAYLVVDGDHYHELR